MAVVVDVALISGRKVSLEADLDASVQSLKRRAQEPLGVGKCRLLNASGSNLEGDAKLVAAGWQMGDFLTLQIGGIQICAGRRTCYWATVLGDGSVVTQGGKFIGCASSDVQSQLKNVQQIQASSAAFAAILDDGCVVTWGDTDCGGDSSAVQDQLKNVQQIQATSGAFAAILGDRSVVSWGDNNHGGDSMAV